jgi:hypothetical protein
MRHLLLIPLLEKLTGGFFGKEKCFYETAGYTQCLYNPL